MYKTHHSRSTFGSWDVEKVHAVVAGSTFRNQHVKKKLTCSDHFWKLRCWKSARRYGTKHVSKSKCTKQTILSTFGSWDVEKARAVVAGSTFRNQHVKKNNMFGPVLDVQMSLHGARELCTLSKISKTWGYCSIVKNAGKRGTFEEGLQRCICVAGAVQETCSSEMFGGQGADILRGVAFWSIRSSGLLRWFCVTGAALRMSWPHFLVAGAVL